MSVSEANTSEHEVLRQRITELESENSKTNADKAVIENLFNGLRVNVMNEYTRRDAEKAEYKKELESKKNRKFQEKCILIAQVLLGEEPNVEYRPSFMRGLELDAFFRHHHDSSEDI
ncbi:hypothetical protein C1645_813589 [Glomus cerebriforme]|uniref:Uncharacterized protein n=1 Tax=Glomus cerebriforme TaxID=658196 RepID=A0A397TS27_9GLOM|nr:hypothetical protein C1645_813589 [Glomus cerebriforme]